MKIPMTRLLRHLHRLAEQTSWRSFWVALIFSLLTLAGGLTWATILYARSGFAPRLIEGQLAFNPAQTRAWYAALIEQGTLDIYRRTQWVDFIFIAGLLATLFILHLMIAKARRNEPGWQRLALWLAVLGPAIATADIWENLVTLMMLSAPTTFPSALAILASTLSVVKWGWAVIGTSLVLVQLIALAWQRISRGGAPRPTNSSGV